MYKGFLVTCMILSVACSAQTAKKPTPSAASHSSGRPLPLERLLGVACDTSAWELAFAFGERDKKDEPKKGEDTVSDLTKSVSEKATPDWGQWLIAEHGLLMRNQSALSRFLGRSTMPLLYTSLPMRFAEKDGSLVLLETCVASDNVYNTLRLSAKERAAKEIDATVLKAMKEFRNLSLPEVKSFGVVAEYGTRDFSEHDSRPKPEMVTLIASVSNCRKLDQLEITEEDFVALSDVYILENAFGEVRKVKISLGQH